MQVTTPLPTSAPPGGGVRSIQTRVVPAASLPAAPSWQRHSTNNLKRLIDALASCPAPHLLDLGRLCDQNINWLIHHRCKVTVDDQISSLPPPPPKAPPLPPSHNRTVKEKPPAPIVLDLQQPAANFDAILCWDLFDYLAGSGAQLLLQRLVALLKPRGCLLAFFNCERTAARPATRYRILGAEQLEYEPLQTHPPGRRYENREIQELFAGLDLVNSCYLPNQMREILIQKKPDRRPRS